MGKQWHIRRPDIEKVKAIQRQLKCSFITATILCNRRIESHQAASDFISPSFHHLQPPFVMQDMDRAVERIEYAISKHENILVFGDYDVDGVTAAAALYTFLQRTGARVAFHIPHRIDEGYGLSPGHIHQIAIPNKIQLIITVDNGSSSHAAVKAAEAAGIDVIITDHHTTSGILPPAFAVVNPKRDDCRSNLEHLSGVGVVFCLLICLRKRLREKGFWRNKKEPNLKAWCDLVALGTIADMVPLVADNRILTRAGIDLINTYPRPGIKALIDALNIGKASINAEDIAFRLAPRLNAAGRMAHAQTAMALLLTPSLSTAREVCEKLNQLNALRKETENILIADIEAMLDDERLRQNTIVVCGENWHAGVLGIVASRITNRFCKPAIVFSEKNGIAKGSARSIPGLDVYAAIAACKEELIQFGGHSAAAGITLATDRLQPFKERFEASVSAMTQASHFVEKITIDCEIFFKDIDPDLLTELDALQPFGQENPAPLFMAKNIEILSAAPMGQNHRRLLLRQKGNTAKRIPAIQFNVDPDETQPELLNQMAFRLQWNHWNGSRKIQLVVEAT